MSKPVVWLLCRSHLQLVYGNIAQVHLLVGQSPTVGSRNVHRKPYYVLHVMHASSKGASLVTEITFRLFTFDLNSVATKLSKD
jgi:hypothetical protein